jgi:hypothetical protein
MQARMVSLQGLGASLGLLLLRPRLGHLLAPCLHLAPKPCRLGRQAEHLL